jgi:hypothetical protein
MSNTHRKKSCARRATESLPKPRWLRTGMAQLYEPWVQLECEQPTNTDLTLRPRGPEVSNISF